MGGYLFLVLEFAVFGGADRFEEVSAGSAAIGDFKIAVCEFAHGVVVSRKSHELYRGGVD